MDKKLKARWVKALRSGKYKQGKGTLCKIGADGERRYCCLGVLAEVYEGKKLKLDNYDKQSYAGTLDEMYSDDLLDMFGFDLQVETALIDKNDKERCKFSTIANYIEKNL